MARKRSPSITLTVLPGAGQSFQLTTDAYDVGSAIADAMDSRFASWHEAVYTFVRACDGQFCDGVVYRAGTLRRWLAD